MAIKALVAGRLSISRAFGPKTYAPVAVEYQPSTTKTCATPARTHARSLARTHRRPTDERCDVRSAGVADWKTARGGNTERTLTAAAGPSPRDPYRHALTMRPSQKARPFSFFNYRPERPAAARGGERRGRRCVGRRAAPSGRDALRDGREAAADGAERGLFSSFNYLCVYMYELGRLTKETVPQPAAKYIKQCRIALCS